MQSSEIYAQVLGLKEPWQVSSVDLDAGEEEVTQVDLPPGVTSGLVHALSILRGVKGIGVVELGVKDIVRHQVVWRIIEAYDGRQSQRRKRRG